MALAFKIKDPTKTSGVRLLEYVICITWLTIAIISVNHMILKWHWLAFNLPILGALYFSAFCMTFVYLCKDNWRPALLVFGTFLLIGLICGPFLEPLGDPLDHLGNIHDGLTKNSAEIYKYNRGLWHYAMSGFLLKPFQAWIGPLRGLDLLHGLYCGLLTACIFLVGIRCQASRNWAFFSCIVAFSFFGSRQFSYLSYYSFAPSSSSLMLFWIWVAVYFFTHDLKNYINGLLAALIFTPILLTNHIQEAVFLWFTVGVYTLYCATRMMAKMKGRYGLIAWVVFLLGALFVLPQFEFFRDWLAQFFIINDWDKNQRHVYAIGNIHVMGAVWKTGVYPTLGMIGFLPLIYFVALVLPNRDRYPVKMRSKPLF